MKAVSSKECSVPQGGEGGPRNSSVGHILVGEGCCSATQTQCNTNSGGQGKSIWAVYVCECREAEEIGHCL